MVLYAQFKQKLISWTLNILQRKCVKFFTNIGDSIKVKYSKYNIVYKTVHETMSVISKIVIQINIQVSSEY